ncbi:MAG TPA: PQQ-dependent sugar dehydrogenase [Solirubrobacteraceae bacterium]|nr:PQQ-dependent sugar dehydrogenase [Solirubrobacteraceae bacterium]
MSLLLVAGCGGGDGEEQTAPADDEMRVEVVAESLEVPWEIVWLPDGRALITERPGRIRMLDGTLVAEVPVSALGEGGLMGLALDPEFESQPFVYLYFTTADGLQLERWRFEDDRLTREASLIDGVIEAGPVHDSGRIAFGPDDALYVATGDAGNEQLAQDEDSLNGKYLRLTDYRGGPTRPEIVSTGHRNPQGFDWEPETDRLISTEHGPAGFDEINEIEEGNNYGWPAVTGTDHGDFTAPLRVYEQSVAPSGATFWEGAFWFATLRGEALRRLSLDDESEDVLLENEYGRLRTVRVGPDGALYVLTSNRDGRGTPEDGDDRVLRLSPP